MNLWRLERKIAWVDIVVTRLGGTGLFIINTTKIKKVRKVSMNVKILATLKEGACTLFFLS